MFGTPECRCSKRVVRKWHLRYTQTAFAHLANGICDGRKWRLQPTISERRRSAFPNIDVHHLGTSATMLSEGRLQAANTPTATDKKNTTSRGGLWYLGEWYPRGYFENIIFSLLNILANTYENATA